MTGIPIECLEPNLGNRFFTDAGNTLADGDFGNAITITEGFLANNEDRVRDDEMPSQVVA